MSAKDVDLFQVLGATGGESASLSLAAERVGQQILRAPHMSCSRAISLMLSLLCSLSVMYVVVRAVDPDAVERLFRFVAARAARSHIL